MFTPVSAESNSPLPQSSSSPPASPKSASSSANDSPWTAQVLPPTAAASATSTSTAAATAAPSMQNGGVGLRPSPPVVVQLVKRTGLTARLSPSLSANGSCEPLESLPLQPVEGIPSFYPQSLWEEMRKQGKADTDRMTRKTTYRLAPHKRLVAGKYVEDPDLKDFSNPQYKGRSGSRSPASRLSRLGEFLGTRPPPAPSPGRVPQPVYASSIVGARTRTVSSGTTTTNTTTTSATTAATTTTTTTTNTTNTTTTSGSYSTIDSMDYEEDDEGCEDTSGSDSDGSSDDEQLQQGRLPLIGPRRQQQQNARGRVGRSVKQTIPVVEPVYPFSAASFYFPIYYGRPSILEKEDPRGLPQEINEELHPHDRAAMPLSTLSVQKDNLNRMGLFKIGPGAVAFKVVITAFEAAGMKYTKSNSRFNILWAKRATPYTLASLSPYQKVNHFPGAWGIGRKDSLAQNMSKMRRFFGEDVYDIVPASFLIPRQEHELKADAERNPGTPEKPLIYIVKPSASSCGRGIELFRGVPPMPRGGKQMVCQRYIGNPLLIFGRKFDLRLYCVVTSFDPLRIYIFDEGLVRFAAEKYPGPDQELDNIHMHLTNYSVNKTADLNRESSGKDYDSDDPMDIKWCLSDFKKHLMQHHPLGLEAWNRIRRECDDVVVKTLISIENDVVERLRYECSDKTGRNCFELFGLDLMADDDLKVRLIEVNIMPSLATGSSLDKAVKSRMLAHMLTLVRAMPYRRNAMPKPGRGRRRQQPPQPPQPPQAQRAASRSHSNSTRGGSQSPGAAGTLTNASSGRAGASAASRTASTNSRASRRGNSRPPVVAGARTRSNPHASGAEKQGEEEEEEEEARRRRVGEPSPRRGRSQQPPSDEESRTAAAGATGTASTATNATTASRQEKFIPLGAAATRPERTYAFGRHPMASARIVQRPLLTAFNNPNESDSMLSPYESLMLVEAEEELRCAGGFRRVFPDSATVHEYLPLFTHGVRRNNYVLVSATLLRENMKPKMD